MAVGLSLSEARTLDHARKGGLSDVALRFMGGWDYNIPALTEAGLIVGEWAGSLEYEPYRRWRITEKGETALHEFQMAELRKTVPKCDEGQCAGPYGSEVYVRTDCVTCGCPIVRAKRA